MSEKYKSYCGSGSNFFNETAHRIWNESELIALKKEREHEDAKKEFLAYLKEFIKEQFDIDASQLSGDYFEKYGFGVYDALKDHPPSDKDLIGEITRLLTKILNLPHDEGEEIKIIFNDSYLYVFKALWGEGVPLYLSRFVNRREEMNCPELRELWKPSLRRKIRKLREACANGEIDEQTCDEECYKLMTQAEQDVWDEVKDTFKELCESLFEKDVSQIFTGELSTNSISKLQKIFREEDGCTKQSWEIRNMAYLKFMYIFALIKIFGTIDFERLEKTREVFQDILLQYEKLLDSVGAEVEETRIDVKTKLSVVLKYVKKMLNRRAGYYPADIRDLVRLRVSVNIPEVLLEDESIAEIKDYITEVLKVLIPVFGASYVKNRLRNSFVSDGVNSFSGKKHKALQVTFLPLMDTDGELSNCSESVPLEVQIRKKLTGDERAEDDVDYKLKKINRLRHDSGVDVRFSDYVSHLADIFIKRANFNDKEQKGGEPWLSEKELLAIDFLKIISTDDEETKEYLRNEWGGNKLVYKRKIGLAIREISNYWSKKLELFIKNRIYLIQDIVEKRGDEIGKAGLVDRIKNCTEKTLDYIETSQPDFEKIKGEINHLRTILGICEYEKYNATGRLFTQISDLERYFLDRKEINITELIEAAEEKFMSFFA